MKVAEVAQRAGVGAHAVRFYVRAGLLKAGRDPFNNYKQFGEPHVLRLRFIKGAQALGFTLAEIRALLERMDAGECTCDEMRLRLGDKILQLREQIEDLMQRQDLMERVYHQWQAGADGRHDLGRLCRFLEQQAGAESGSPAGDPGGHVTLDHRTALRISADRSSGTTGKRAPRGECTPRARTVGASRGRKGKTGSAAEGSLAVLKLLRCEWCSAS